MDKSSVNGVLKFIDYTVNKVNFITNDSYTSTGEPIKLNFDLGNALNIVEDKMIITIELNVFPNMKESNYPFSIDVEMSGIFQFYEENPERFEANALAILYPYLRALVSTYTANSNIPPLILPTINLNKYIEQRK